MKMFLRTLAIVGVSTVGLVAKPAEAQVSLGIATPGFSLGVGPGAGFVGGGFYPGYPAYGAVIAPPIYAPRPVYLPPPIYGRPVYGGYGPGPGYAYGRPGYAAPRYAYPPRRYR